MRFGSFTNILCDQANALDPDSLFNQVRRSQTVELDEVANLDVGPTQVNIPRLGEFVIESWAVLEPGTPLDWNWHIDVMADHIEALLFDWLKRKDDINYQQRIQNLLINVPPGSLKSRLVNVCTPAWWWLHCPTWKALYLSANIDVSQRDSLLCRDLIESEWYQGRFQPQWRLRKDSNAKKEYWNTAGGVRKSAPIMGRITGARYDNITIDDPHDAAEIKSKAKRESVINKYKDSIANRLNDLRISTRIGIMQRLSELDWSQHVLESNKWCHLCIKQEYEVMDEPNELGWIDPRSQPGELMFEQRFPSDVLMAEHERLGPQGYAAQHQQNPAPAEGGMFKIANWTIAAVPPAKLQEKKYRSILSMDCSFKDGAENDFTAIGNVIQIPNVRQVTGIDGNKYWLHQYWIPFIWRGKADIVKAETELNNAIERHPDAYIKLIEDKANGTPIIQRLQEIFKGIEAFNPGTADKVERAAVAVPIQQRGDIIVPASEEVAKTMIAMGIEKMTIRDWWELYPPTNRSDKKKWPVAKWVIDFINETSKFPNAAHDDQVDMLSQAIIYLQKLKPPQKFKSADNVYKKNNAVNSRDDSRYSNQNRRNPRRDSRGDRGRF